METKKKKLLNCIKVAKEEGYKYMACKYFIEEYNSFEVIINTPTICEKVVKENLVYLDDNLCHKRCPGNKIIDFEYGNSFRDIEKKFIGINNKNSINIDVKFNIEQKEIERIAIETQLKVIDYLKKSVEVQRRKDI